jgi:hypothetical protein
LIKRCAAIAAVLFACSGEDRPPPARAGELVLSEIASVNPGGGPRAARDDHGDYDDWIELYNAADHPVDLAGLQISDNADNPARWRIPEDPAFEVHAKSYVLLFADGETFQGSAHLPFGLARAGESLVVSTISGEKIAGTTFPEMRGGQSWAAGEGGAFALCETPTPGAANLCEDVTPPPKKEYAAYPWPDVYPAPLTSPLVIAELDVFGTANTASVAWVELLNQSPAAIDLSTVTLTSTVITPPASIPNVVTGVRVPLSGMLAAGARKVVNIPFLRASGGALLLFNGNERSDYVAFESLQPATVLMLPRDGRGLRIACDVRSATPGAPNGDCLPPPARTSAPPMLRVIGSEADFDAMAGPFDETTTDAAAVKFIVDRDHENAVYFVDSGRWKLHFDWVWEVIEKQRPLDLCIQQDIDKHALEWRRFSVENYFKVEERRYFLGTVIHYRDSDLWTVEFTPGDLISKEMVREAFFAVAQVMFNGKSLYLRPTTDRLEKEALALEGTLPIIATDKPFEGQKLQTLNAAVGYGVLERVRADELETAPISYQSIVILDRLPIDLPPVSGSITEEFQTPLSHVNVLAQNRGTPNMALEHASTDPRIAPFIGQLVRFEVTLNDFDIRVATATEAEAWWRERYERPDLVVPPRDLNERRIISLDAAGFDSVSVIGAKASQYAELMSLSWPSAVGTTNPHPMSVCGLGGPVLPHLPIPRPAFAIPFSRYVEHLARNGIDTELEAFLNDEDTLRDPVKRREALTQIRARIETAPVDPELSTTLFNLIRDNYGNDRVRFRSSTNVEDLEGFNGAGLYESRSAQISGELRPVEDALRQVWSSIWSVRGFEERELFGVDQRAIAMGVLIHRGFPDEEANGVAITKNVIAPDSHGHYLNAQDGEISVVQPETGDLPEQLLYKLFTPPDVLVLARSTATAGAPVLQDRELHRLNCVLFAIHNHFADHYGVNRQIFGADVEWKIVGPNRDVVVKQARPWAARGAVEPNPCAD